MDVIKALGELYLEKKRLDQAIASLEVKQRGPGRNVGSSGKRRGRKSMSVDERRDVSRRMAEYWAARKASGSSEPQSVSENVPKGQPETDLATA